MAIYNDQSLFKPMKPLHRTLDRMALLRQSQVNFVPIGQGRTIRTAPLLEDTTVNWKERYIEAAIIYLTNPYCFAAQSLLNDELADGRVIVEEKQGTLWKEHTTNTLSEWIQHPNPTMDIKEFFRAYGTHFHTFGSVSALMLQKGDILANGKINLESNCFDIIFPGRMAEDALSNPYGIDWYYLPMGFEEPFKVKNENLFMDVIYNPVAHNLGVALPTNPLNQIFKIHKLYVTEIERLLDRGGIPTHLLTRIVDITKDAGSMSIQDSEVEEAIQRVYANVGRHGRNPNGWLGLRGDWRVNRMGSPLAELMNKDLFHYVESLITAVYGIPSSIFWIGLEASNQRASRQQDSIDFYNRKIKPMQERICQRLSQFLVPKFLGEKEKKNFRISIDVSEMALAQYAIQKTYRMYERWYQFKIINRGKFLNYVNEPTDDYSLKELDEYYDGGKNIGLNAGKGEQDTEDDNGLE